MKVNASDISLFCQDRSRNRIFPKKQLQNITGILQVWRNEL